jgi:carbon monoxide dehydrogenase subunit G
MVEQPPMIEVNERFEVAAAPRRVWEVLADPYTVVGCVPGAAIVEETEDGAYDTTLSVRFGPLSVGFEARTTLELQPETMRGWITAHGRDKQGGTRFNASAAFGVAAQPDTGGSIVSSHGEVELSGRLASLIEGGAGAVIRRMSSDFAACLSQRCA